MHRKCTPRAPRARRRLALCLALYATLFTRCGVQLVVCDLVYALWGAVVVCDLVYALWGAARCVRPCLRVVGCSSLCATLFTRCGARLVLAALFARSAWWVAACSLRACLLF